MVYIYWTFAQQHGRGQRREARGVTETTWAASAINNSKAIQHC